MKENEAKSLEYLFHDEGGYLESATEGGGAANMGITFTTFQQWRRIQKMQAPTLHDLRSLSKTEASDIYRFLYLTPTHFDYWPVGVDYAIMDAAVHSGVHGSIRFLQEALGFKYEDEFPKWSGHIITGDITLDTAWAVHQRDPKILIRELIAIRRYRQSHMLDRKEKKEPHFKRPLWERIWGDRNRNVRTRALEMAGAKNVELEDD